MTQPRAWGYPVPPATMKADCHHGQDLSSSVEGSNLQHSILHRKHEAQFSWGLKIIKKKSDFSWCNDCTIVSILTLNLCLQVRTLGGPRWINIICSLVPKDIHSKAPPPSAEEGTGPVTLEANRLPPLEISYSKGLKWKESGGLGDWRVAKHINKTWVRVLAKHIWLSDLREASSWHKNW